MDQFESNESDWLEEEEEEAEQSDYDFDFESEEWVLAGDALRETIEFYLAAGDGDRKAAYSSALAAIRKRLFWGRIVSRARHWNYWVKYDGVVPEHADLFADQGSGDQHTDVVFHGFWWALDQAEEGSKAKGNPEWRQEHSAELDWIAGDFEFRSRSEINPKQGGFTALIVEGAASGVCFNRSGLPSTNRIQGRTPERTISRHPRKQGIPRLPEATLLSWWGFLPPEVKAQDQVSLLELCRAAFPRHHISRDRIRALDPGRKRGPKPIRE